MNSVERMLSKLWSRVLRSTAVDAIDLSLFRILVGIYFLFLGLKSFAWIGTVPDAFFDPPYLSLANLFSGFPPQFFFQVVDILYPILIVMLVLGIKSRYVTWLLVGMLVFASNFEYSFGKIDHNILTFWTLVCLSFTNWGRFFALVPDKKVSSDIQSHALGMLALGIAFGLFTAGLEKGYIWVDFDLETSGFLGWYHTGYYALGRDALLAPYLLGMPNVVYETMDYVAVSFELSGFLWLILGRRFWHAWLLIACMFHTLNLLILNIPFVSMIFVYGAFLIPTILQKFRLSSRLMKLGSTWGWLLAVGPIVLCLVYLYQYLCLGSTRLMFLINEESAETEVRLYLYLAMWLLFFGLALFAYLFPPRIQSTDAV